MLAALLTATVALLLFYLACLKQRANDISARHATLIFVLALIASVTLGILVFALGLIPGEDRANRFGARA